MRRRILVSSIGNALIDTERAVRFKKRATLNAVRITNNSPAITANSAPMRNANAKSLVWISEKTNAYSGYGKTIASVIVKKGEAVSENRGNGNTQNFLGLLVLIPEKLATP
ncbi:MAG: hypothetical protein VB039_08815 [Oscillospiraceae bacterium]|nr:hypothetical protein [Oscillospiraceae bacterium]